MKIAIIGPSGGGKSVLAKKLCEKFSFPKLEMDRLWFSCGGEKYPNGCSAEQKEEINNKIRDLVLQFMTNNKSWVIEGVYSGTQLIVAKEADIVIVIRRPLLSRVFSHVWRVFRGRDRHPEVTMLQDLGFVRTILKRWRKGENKKMDELMTECSEKVIVLKSFKEIDRYFNTLSTDSFKTDRKSA